MADWRSVPLCLVFGTSVLTVSSQAWSECLARTLFPADGTSDMNGKRQFDENAVYEWCGKFGAFQFGDRRLCAECYEAMGSCCPEFGGYDQWKFEDELPRRLPKGNAAKDPNRKAAK